MGARHATLFAANIVGARHPVRPPLSRELIPAERSTPPLAPSSPLIAPPQFIIHHSSFIIECPD